MTPRMAFVKRDFQMGRCLRGNIPMDISTEEVLIFSVAENSLLAAGGTEKLMDVANLRFSPGKVSKYTCEPAVPNSFDHFFATNQHGCETIGPIFSV